MLVSNSVSIPIDNLIFAVGAFGGVLPWDVVWQIFLFNLIIKYVRNADQPAADLRHARPGLVRRPMSRRIRPPSPLSQFMLLSAAILIVGGAFLAWWMDRRIVQVVTDDSITMAGVFVDSTIAPHLAELDSLADISPSQEAHLTQLMRNNVASGRYVAINVWSTAGDLVFTTLMEPETGPAQQEQVAAALTGGVITHYTDQVHGQPAPGMAVTGNFLESYFRVQAPFTGEPLESSALRRICRACSSRSSTFACSRGWWWARRRR